MVQFGEGFGFAEVSDGSGDAFLHVSVMGIITVLLYSQVRVRDQVRSAAKAKTGLLL